MRFVRFSRVAMAAALLLSMSASLAGFGSTALAQSTTTHDLAKSSPADALLYVDLSLDTTSAQWKQAIALLGAIGGSSTNNVVGMASDDGITGGEAALVVTNLNAVSSAAGSVTGAVDSAVGGPSSSSGLNGVLGSILNGSSATGTPAPESAAAPAGLAVIVKPKDAVKGWASLQKSFNDSASSASATPSQTTYKDVSISSYAGVNGGTGEAIAKVGDVLVEAETPADIEPIIDVAHGDAKSLATVANFTKGAGALTGEHLAFGFINGKAAGSNIGSAAGKSLGSMTDAINALVGADHDTAFQLNAATTGLGIQTVELPNADVTAQVVLEPAGNAASLTGAAKVPANSLIFVNGYNLGKSAVMQALGLAVVSLFSGLSGDTATPVATPTTQDLYTATAGFLGFNLSKDFLDQLTGKYVFALWADNLSSAASINGVLASDAADPAALQVTVSGLGFLIQAIGQGSASVKTVTYGSSALSEATIGAGAAAASIDFGVADRQFVLGIGGGAKTYLTGTSDSLADSADYKAAFKTLPAEYDGVAYINVAALSAMSASTGGSILDSTPVAVAAADASKVKSFAMVSYKKDGLAYTSSMLVIETK